MALKACLLASEADSMNFPVGSGDTFLGAAVFFSLSAAVSGWMFRYFLARYSQEVSSDRRSELRRQRIS
ncbi:hypothetical protein COY93_04320 [Candidatus Uhrbacteria bacterium CG_4_10_14_0_8_um_filter_58_22]|uniref:Uncharacterized protein n=1 Tax=Candidatus Uhrbacteria bacterium CG_4_10_14_0_8_um_filter_58_22 TaxID=1975029 RepID=A0A2M7Q9P2_9BACT|nr:MAG: hypothetical protein AUJ19_02180 [Parcubacteria group bacterium CG1_02_58_44]PIY61941.1 MAG: hypothetical protein COY93_04320 [Candidatus Uhrbacteria bacterium CG_4_10_14_0_8_um_filter_58_22]